MHRNLNIALSVILLTSLILIIFPILSKKNISTKEDEPLPSLDDEIAQMLIIGYNDDENELKRINIYAENAKISGLIFYKSHIKSPNQIRAIISNLNKISKTKLFIMLDQEGGLVSRIDYKNYFNSYESAQYIAQNHTPKEAYDIYYKMAKDLKDVGFNFNLAPCVDIYATKKSKIGRDARTYGNNPQIVTKYAMEFVKAHNDAGVITALKHFTGIVSTKIDTHQALPDITKNWNEEEIIPFRKIITIFPNQPVMVGHVMNKKIDSENISSLSSKTINLLNKNKNYKGLIIIDAIDMTAIQNLEAEDIIIKAINSDVNLFIFPNHNIYPKNQKIYITPDDFISIVHKAIDNGLIDKKKIDNSYKKVRYLKETKL